MDGWKILWDCYEQEGPPHLTGGKFCANRVRLTAERRQHAAIRVLLPN